MIQTRQYIKYVMILMLGVLCIPEIIFAQKFTAKANTTSVPLNGVVQVTYELQNGTAQNFQAPSFKDFEANGPFYSASSSSQTINGQMIQNVTTSWIYSLVPTKVGKFTINAAMVKVNGKVISSNSLTIEVTNATSNGKNTQTNQPQNKTTAATVAANDIFVKAVVDKAKVYQGEQVTIVFKLCTKVNAANIGLESLPSFAGFWTTDLLKLNKDNPQYYETINGEKYAVLDVYKVALFPQKSGTITIDPAVVSCVALIAKKTKISNPFDMFFNNPFSQDQYGITYQEVQKKLKSNSLTISVSTLPYSNQPQDFIGFVGNLKMEAALDKNEIKANEAINLKVKLSGEGNVSLIDRLPIEFPTDFEVYDPQIDEKISTTGNKVSGVKTFNYLIIPRSQGNFTIAPFSISYFDLATRTYKTLKSEAFSVKVNKGDGNTVAVTGKSDVKYLNQDIKHINTGLFALHKKGNLFFHSLFFWIICFLPFLGLAIFIIFMRRRIKLKADTVLLKNKQATRMALKRLQLAKQLLQKKELDGFYIELSKGLWGYLADKFAIPGSRLSLATAEETLMSKNLSEESRKKFIDILNQCEYSRFSPNGKLETQAELLYNEAINIIVQTEQELKK